MSDAGQGWPVSQTRQVCGCADKLCYCLSVFIGVSSACDPEYNVFLFVTSSSYMGPFNLGLQFPLFEFRSILFILNATLCITAPELKWSTMT